MDINSQIITLTNPSVIFTLDITPDGEKLAIGQQADYLGTVPNLTLWSIKDRQLLAEIEHMKDAETIDSARFSADGKILFYTNSFSSKRGIRLFDVKLYDILAQKHLETALTSVNVSWLSTAKKSHRLVTSGMVTEVWNIETYRRYWFMEDYIAFKANQRPAADITPDGSKVAVVGKDINQVHIYDIEQNVIIQTLDDAPLQARWASFSPDLSYFAALSAYAQFFLWDLATGERHLANRFNPENSAYWSVCFHPNSKYLASGSLVGFVSVFRLSDGVRIVMQKVHEGRVWSLAFTPDGKKLISGGEDGIVSILELNSLLDSDV